VNDSNALWQELQKQDRKHVWHPYAASPPAGEIFPVVSAEGVRLTLADGRELIDGMASWWCAIHGYNHPVINRAVQQQLETMSHVMFGGLTHPPAVKLAQLLVRLTPDALQHVFFSDSGSVSVEVALKMAIQYWQAAGRSQKQKIVALRSGYHGDTFGAMSVCDPVTGMHHLFGDVLASQFFVPSPTCGFNAPCPEGELEAMTDLLSSHHGDIAAVIVEPIVQGAGGMRFYSPDYLRQLRALCDAFDVLLIFDEIATGFGRTGKLFALEHAGVEPDILCLGKSLTGGYMTLAATLCTQAIAKTISNSEAGAFMHGPTFMANPLACATAIASIELLLSQPWARTVQRLNLQLEEGLSPARKLPQVREVRTLGAIGVIELHEPVDMIQVQPMFVERGVWVRPFGRLIYAMPPYIMGEQDITTLTSAMVEVAGRL
jgi:adenosylmethionine---8-amino-7-oxononanoate aminotransferase